MAQLEDVLSEAPEGTTHYKLYGPIRRGGGRPPLVRGAESEQIPVEQAPENLQDGRYRVEWVPGPGEAFVTVGEEPASTPAVPNDANALAAGFSSANQTVVKLATIVVRSNDDLRSENKDLRARIKELETELAQLSEETAIDPSTQVLLMLLGTIIQAPGMTDTLRELIAKKFKLPQT